MSRALPRFTLVLALFGISLYQGNASARGPACAGRDNNTFEKLLECVTLEGVRTHQAALQAIADANGGNRSAATQGYAASVEYAQSVLTDAGYTVTVQEFTFGGTSTSYNVLAESRHGDPDNVVMAGAHLDSVLAGPGIQDNGSGVAAILEIARQMAKVRPRNKVRFALWGAEEQGLLGSTHYVNNLSPADQDRIALYLNFDMIASPNYGLFIFDGDDSESIGSTAPPGSDDIEATFEDFYSRFNLPFKATPFDARSDYDRFLTAGIPVGGLFTGAEIPKTAQEAALWGGTAGVAFDPCFHQACDTYDNVNTFALDINSDAAAFAILKYAMSTQAVNGIRGKNLRWK